MPLPQQIPRVLGTGKTTKLPNNWTYWHIEWLELIFLVYSTLKCVAGPKTPTSCLRMSMLPRSKRRSGTTIGWATTSGCPSFCSSRRPASGSRAFSGSAWPCQAEFEYTTSWKERRTWKTWRRTADIGPALKIIIKFKSWLQITGRPHGLPVTGSPLPEHADSTQLDR